MSLCQREERRRNKEGEETEGGDEMDGVTLYCGGKRRKENGRKEILTSCTCVFPFPCVWAPRESGERTKKKEKKICSITGNNREGYAHSSSRVSK